MQLLTMQANLCASDSIAYLGTQLKKGSMSDQTVPNGHCQLAVDGSPPPGCAPLAAGIALWWQQDGARVALCRPPSLLVRLAAGRLSWEQTA